MKKMTQTQKNRNTKNACRSQLGQKRFKFIQRETNRHKSNVYYLPVKYRKPPLTYKEKNRHYIDLPEYMSLTHNYERTLDFINKYRDLIFIQRCNVCLNFKTLKYISAGAALLFVSELDRWREVYKVKPLVIEIEKWDPVVRKYLFQLGFFNILKVVNPPSEKDIMELGEVSPVEFLPFQSNNLVLGGEVVNLREQLENLSGNKVAKKSQMFRAITEAMTNVSKHAYPKHLEFDKTTLYKRWWMTGSFNKGENKISVIFFDQGVGIPNTLPNKYPTEMIYSFLKNLGLNISNDGALIRAAMELGRSQTELSHRGKGLPDVKRYIEMHGMGSLRIISGRGEYKYDTGKDPEIYEYKNSIGGTLIQWDVPL